MGKHERTMRIDSVDESGFFMMTLATEGEASDGDILSIAGGQVPERMPLLLSHFNDPTAKAGSVTDPAKELKHVPPRLRSRGQIELDGVGALKDVRRDVAFMVNKHGGAVSIRWDEVDGGDPPIRRVNLASDHPYFVDGENEKSWRKRNGYFWPSWQALEGSIVALGADPDATIGGRLCAARAEETTGEVSTFWRSMAAAAEAKDAEPSEKDNELTTLEACLADIAGIAISARAEGCQPADLINAVAIESDGEEFAPITVGEHRFLLPTSIAEQLESERAERAEPKAQPEPDPEPEPAQADQPAPLTLDAADIKGPLDVQAFGQFVEQRLDEFEQNVARKVRGLLDSYTGKV